VAGGVLDSDDGLAELNSWTPDQEVAGAAVGAAVGAAYGDPHLVVGGVREQADRPREEVVRWASASRRRDVDRVVDTVDGQ